MVKTLKNEVDMLNVPVFKGILRFTIPIMVMNVCQSLFNIVDMTMLKAMVNDDAVGYVFLLQLRAQNSLGSVYIPAL